MLAQTLKELRFKKNITQSEFANILGVAQQTVGSWEKNKSTPNYDLLKKIADYFNVTTDYLLGHKDLQNEELNEDEINLLTAYRQLNDNDKQLTKSMLERMLPKKKKSSIFPITSKISINH